MASLDRAQATLRICSPDIDLELVTSMLGCEPTKARKKGEQLKRGGKAKAGTGMWYLQANQETRADIDGQIMELLDRVSGDLEVWNKIGASCNVDLFCGWFLLKPNEGLELYAATLKSLGDRSIILSIDIYAGDNS